MQNLEQAKTIVKNNKGKVFSLYVLVFVVGVVACLIGGLANNDVVNSIIAIILALYLPPVIANGFTEIQKDNKMSWGNAFSGGFHTLTSKFGTIILAYLINFLLSIPIAIVLFLVIFLSIGLAVPVAATAATSSAEALGAAIAGYSVGVILLFIVVAFAVNVYSQFLGYLLNYKMLGAADNKKPNLKGRYGEMWKMALISCLWLLIPVAGIVFYFIWYAYYMTKIRLDIAGQSASTQQ